MNRLPSIFMSHGAPTFATEPRQAGPLLREVARQLPTPRAIVVLSPHWMTPNVRVSFVEKPETIHDFGGFPAELYEIEYPAVGSPQVAARALQLLQAAGWNATEDRNWGLDHGAWVPLLHMYPDAEVPVLQVSMPRMLDAAGALHLGRTLAPLAAEGVLLVGSGGITHNLYNFVENSNERAGDFIHWARDALKRGDEAALVNYLSAAPNAHRAHPTPDHYLPLPFAFGAAAPGASVRILDGQVSYGALAMDNYVLEPTGA